MKKVIVVDDEPGLRQSLGLLLTDAGYTVTAEQDGRRALERATAESFDLILCDVRMPQMDGLTFLRNYRQRGGGALVIVMSAYGGEDAAIAAMQEGAYDYLPKPFRPDEVVLTLRKAEEREGLRQEVAGLRAQLAAGPAEHARNLARRGLQATALDLNPAMCARARDLAAKAGILLTVVQADMRDFSLPGPFDLAITMLNSLCHLLTLDDMLRHLTAVGRHLDQNGLYIMELAHPADFFGAERRTSSEWSSKTGDGTVSVRWGAQDQIDPVTQVTREHVSVTYHKRGGPVRTVTDVVPNRFWTATELAAAIRLAGGFTLAASYGDFDGDVPVDAADAWRMILVLRRE